MPGGRRRTHRTLVLAGALFAALVIPANASAASPPLLPDLRMASLREFHLLTINSGPYAGHRLLRFTTIMLNVGKGPLEIRGHRDCVSTVECPTMTTVQRIRLQNGDWKVVPSTGKMKYEVGDHHHHWHVIGMERYDLFDVQDAGGGTPLRGHKFGFCFFDLARWENLPGSPSRGVYVEEPEPPNPGCGTPSSLSTRVGLSVGWGDIYPWNFAGQYIDVTNLPNGRYLVCATANPKGRYRELHDWNNQAWARIRITGGSLTVLADGRSQCAKQLPPPPPPPPSPSPSPSTAP